jgi:predicted Zn-dependent protease with MMP-like domain
MGPAVGPARIFLYRRPILDEWCERGDVGLSEIIAHVLIHEIGHHFGLDDDQIHHIEDED